MIAGRYTLEREVGRGGMGAVWMGRDITLDRVVALKRIGVAPGGQTPDLRRAEREARLAAMVNHPHVVAVFDMIEDNDQQWLVMEYVEGRSLAQLIRENGPLDPAFVASALAQVCDALAAAHAAGVVHRDVKPSNILVTDAGVAKLTDFGIARSSADDNQITRTGLVSGSPAYLAPEVASGHPATAASDVWGLGATLFHALAGHPPYAVGENVMGVLYQIVHERPPRLADAGWLGDLLRHTMATHREDRWPMAVVGTFLRHGPEGVRRLGLTIAGNTTETPTAPGEATVAGGSALPSAAAPAEPSNSGPTAQPTPPPAAAPPRRRKDRTLTWAILLLALALVGAVLWTAWTIKQDTDDKREQARESTTSVSPTPTPEPSPTVAQPTAAEMETFIRDYLATVVTDPAQAWPDLTPAFQKASGGYDQYRGFWTNYSGAEVTRFAADPKALTVDYQVRYTLANGSRQTDRVTLELEYVRGTYRIKGEPK